MRGGPLDIARFRLLCDVEEICNTEEFVRPNYEFDWEGLPLWTRQMAGPWAKRRSHVSNNLDQNLWHFVDLADPAKDGPQVDWLIEGFLPSRYLTVLGGDSKSGKTWFVTALALALATGTPFMGMPTRKCGVVWLAFEENEMERQLAFDAYFKAGGVRPERLKFLTCYERIFIDDAEALRQIGEAAWLSEAGLIVVDPLHAAYSAGSISDGATARRVLAGVKGFCSKYNLSVLVLHHLTKRAGMMNRDRIAESGQILAAASMDWLMEVETKPGGLQAEGTECAEGDGRRTLRLIGRGRGAAVNRTWIIESPAPMVYRLAEEAGFGNCLERRVLDVLRAWCEQGRGSSNYNRGGDNMTARELSDATGSPIGSVRNMLGRLLSEGKVLIGSQDGRTRWYTMAG